MAIEHNKPTCPHCGKSDQARIAFGAVDWDEKPVRYSDIWVCGRYECGFQAIKEVEGTLY